MKINQKKKKLTNLNWLRPQKPTPEELKSVFKANQKGKGLFEELSTSRKKQIIWWIESAKRNETRAKRINDIINSLFKNNDE